jgi:hypothetical protein
MSRLDRMTRHVPADQLNRGRENVAAIREQYEQDQYNAELTRRVMATRDKSPMGLVRTDTRNAQAALDAWGELNAALDEALDELEKAFVRERQMATASGPDESDTRRAPVLNKVRGR